MALDAVIEAAQLEETGIGIRLQLENRKDGVSSTVPSTRAGGELTIRLLAYADDIALCSHTVEGLNEAIERIQGTFDKWSEIEGSLDEQST